MSSPKDLDGLYSLLKNCFFFSTILGIRINEENVIKRGCPPSFQKNVFEYPCFHFSIDMCCSTDRYGQFQFSNGSVNSKHAYPASSFGHLLGICLFFLVWKAANAPLWGRAAHTKTPLRGLRKYANALPRDVTKIAFSSKKAANAIWIGNLY